MTTDAMAQIGRVLYGERWQTSLATDLHIADRTMRRWLAGDSAMPLTVEKGLTKFINRTIEAARRHDRLLGQRGGANGVSSSFSSLLQVRRCLGRLTLLNPQALPDADVLLATQGAAEALRQEAERNPQIRFAWLDQAGRPNTHNIQMEIQIAKALQFAQKLSDTAIDLVGASHIELTTKWARDPKIVALSILCRTICNFRGALLLVQQESVVEARALLRLIYENFLWIGALREREERLWPICWLMRPSIGKRSVNLHCI